MPKTKLSLDDIEEIKKSKNVLSASEIQNKYGIGWNRLQKLWGNIPLPDNPLPDNPLQITKLDRKLDTKLDNKAQRSLQSLTASHITLENLIFNLEIIAEENRKQTELLTLLLEKQEEEEEEIIEEEEEEEIIEEEEEEEEEEEKKQTFTIQDIGKIITEFKTLGYVYAGITAVVSVWAISRKHLKEKPVETIKPVETTRPSLFKKEIDPFEF